MQSNKGLFFVIVGGAVLVVAGMFAVIYFFQSQVTELTPHSQKIKIEVVAAPGIKNWAAQAAGSFNAAQTNATVEVVEAGELVPASKFQSAAAWLPEADFVVELARRDGYTFVDNATSVASTSLAWGAYNDKLEAMRRDYGDLTWDGLNRKATSPGGLKLVIASPRTTGAGLAALAAAVAAHQNVSRLSAQDVGNADAWLTQTLGNNNAQPRAEAATTLASPMGRSIADVALLPLAEWRQAKLDQSGQFTVLPVTPTVTLNYPFVLLTSNAAAQQAAQAFQQFLRQSEQQNALKTYGLDSAGAATAGAVQIDGEAAQRLRSWADRTLR